MQGPTTGAFRTSYLDYEELTAQLHRWVEQAPELIRVESLGTTGEGRDIWLATVGRDLDRPRPTVWVDGNMHACELAGSSVALALIEDLLELHGGGGDLPASVRNRIINVPFCIVPRMSPDGAEAVIQSGRYVRSSPRDTRPGREHPHWVRGDIDGDGLSLMMRVEDPGGEFVADEIHPSLMLPRTIADSGPFYKIYPEGTIANFDGKDVPTPDFLSDNPTDLNRNFPIGWAGPHDQVGAGAFPGSEPESRAVLDAAHARPQLFAWINIHCFGGVFIRPLGSAPDDKMNRGDLAIYEQLEEWAQELTGYPMVSHFEEFAYVPDKPTTGGLSDYAYHERGCLAYAVELWDLFSRIGMKRPKRFVEHYSRMTREDLRQFATWDRDVNRGRSLVPWRKIEHPQLGPLEVGGLDFRVGVWNPPYEELDAICRTQSAMALRIAALAPAVEVTLDKKVVGDVTEIEITVENRGYLGTAILDSATSLTHNQGLRIDVDVEGGEIVAGQVSRELGHLDGWGRGVGAGLGLPAYLPGRGTTHRKHHRIAIRGGTHARIRVGSSRTGYFTFSEAL